MKHKDLRPWLSVIVGGESLVSHAGGALLVETARRSGLARELSARLGRWRRPSATHDPGKIVLDLAVAVALGGDAACDVAVLRAQPGVFGPVASDSTVSRLIAALAADADAALAALAGARAARAGGSGPGRGHRSRTGGRDRHRRHPGDRALGHGRRHPGPGRRPSGSIPCWPTPITAPAAGEPVAELLRPGRAGSNTAADHRVVLDAALAQLPAPLRARDADGRMPVLVRTDAAGATYEFAAAPARARGGVLRRRQLRPPRRAHRPGAAAESGVDPGLPGPPAPRRRDRGADRPARRGVGRRGHRAGRPDRLAARAPG